VKFEVRLAKWAAGTAATVAVGAGAFAAGCSGGSEGDGAGGGMTETPAMTTSPAATPTRTSGPSPAPGESATPTAEGGGATPTKPATPTTPSAPTTPATPATAVATATPEPTATPTTLPAPSPTPVKPQNHGDGTFTIVVSQGAARVAVRVEVAATVEQRQLGLMFRQELAEDAGMLFLFGRDVQTGFWMRNTYIPLDIAYIDAGKRVIGIARGVPLNEAGLSPPGPYRYVLEVNAGWFERHGMGVGAEVELPGGLPLAD